MHARSFFYVCAGLFLLALAYHAGARSVAAQGIGSEVAMLGGVAANGDVLPLPRYADGTEALESECQWIVSPAELDWGSGIYHFVCSAEHRKVQVYTCDPNTNCGGAAVWGTTANYLIVAMRSGAPVGAGHATWGQVKVDHR